MRAIACKTIVMTLVAVVAMAADRPPKTTPTIDREAISALERMGAFLREQQTFTIQQRSETDYVLDNGQKIRLSARGDLRVRRPDHLRADVISDRKDRQFFYDGKTFTMFGKRVGLYASVPAPPTILELASLLEERHGLELPMVDMFRMGSDNSVIDQITDATVVGPTKLDGVDTIQYAFRQPGLDWQIWLEAGARPLPRKIILTTTDDPTRPEHTIELTWDLNAKHDDAVFAFVPPKDSAKIPLAEIIPTRGAAVSKAPTTKREGT